MFLQTIFQGKRLMKAKSREETSLPFDHLLYCCCAFIVLCVPPRLKVKEGDWGMKIIGRLPLI